MRISSTSLTESSLFRIGDNSPSISISPNLDLYAQGQNNVKAIFGKRSINISGDLGGNYEAQTQSGSGAYGLFARGGVSYRFPLSFTYHPGNINITGDLSGNVTANSAASEAYGLRAGGDFTLDLGFFGSYDFSFAGDINIDGSLTGNVSATAQNSGAYGLYAQEGDFSSQGGNITIGQPDNGGDLSGNIDVEAVNGSGAYGVYAERDITIHGSFLEQQQVAEGESSGTIRVKAGQDNAYGMYAARDISVGGDVAGSIDAEAGSNNAFGFRAGKDISIGGHYSGSIDVTAGGSDAYGMKAGNVGALDLPTLLSMDWSDPIAVASWALDFRPGSIVIGGDLSGDIDVATTNGSNAYGLFAGGNPLIDAGSGNIAINGSFIGNSINVDSGADNAYGMWAFNDINFGENFAGDLRVTARGNNAYGLSAGIPLVGTFFGEGDIIIGTPGDTESETGDFSGKIITNAGGDGAFGMFAANDIQIADDLSGTGKLVTKADGSGAAGMVAGHDISIGDNLSGKIVTIAGGNAALGMSSGNDVLIGNDLSGKIITKAGGTGASGILALNNIQIGNDLSGKVITIADGNLAAGLSAGDDIEIAGELSGKIISIAKGDGDGFDSFGIGAFGLGALGGIYGATPDESLDISGTVLAKANIGAAGIVAFGPMNLDITGTVAGIDTFIDGENLGFSVLSGSLLTSNDVADKVTVRENGELIGSVNLGAGDDEMTVEDQAIISSVPMLNGGTTLDLQNSEKDVLTFDGWTGTLGDVVINWETIDVLNYSDVDLGKSKVIMTLADGLQEYESQLLKPVNMTIDETSAVRAKGNSPGLYGLVGNLTNNGLFDQMDDEVNDVMALIDYSGSGNDAFYYLDADLSTSGKISTEGLIVAGDVSGKTKVMLNNVDSHVAVTEGDGILFAAVAGSSQNDAFVLENPNDFGPFAVDIARGTSSLTDESWFIVSPGYREEAAVLQAVTPFIERLGYESIMKFHERRAYGWFRYDEGEQEAYWVRMTGSKYRLGMEGDAASELEGYTGWFQIGADLYADGNEDTRFNIGVFAGAGYGEADVAGLRSDKAGELSQTAYGIGAYMTLHQRGAWYLDAVAQAIYNDLSIDYLTEAKQKPDAWSWLASIETGGCIGLGDSFRLQPQAQLVYQHTDGIDLQTLVGEVNIEDHEGLQGRLSLTGIAGACKDDTNPFFEVTLIRDFSESGKVVYQGNAELDPSFDHEAVELASNPERWFLGGAVGLSREVSEKNALGYYIKLGALYGMDSLDSYSYSLMAGLRKTF